MTHSVNNENWTIKGHKQQTIKEFVTRLKELGFTVYLSGNKEYGCYTDDKQDRVACFQVDFCSVIVSGNYKSNRNGTGWQIAMVDNNNFSKEFATVLLYKDSPFEFIRYTTLKEHLETYASSKYWEVN